MKIKKQNNQKKYSVRYAQLPLLKSEAPEQHVLPDVEKDYKDVEKKKDVVTSSQKWCQGVLTNGA